MADEFPWGLWMLIQKVRFGPNLLAGYLLSMEHAALCLHVPESSIFVKIFTVVNNLSVRFE
jgi:hypothetical protein